VSTVETNLVQPSTGTTLTLGASGDTVDVPSGATLDVTGATVSGLSAGKVLQVVQATKTDTASSTNSTFVSTGLEASITPSSTSNKVLVMISASHGQAADLAISFQLNRDSTAIFLGDTAGSRTRTSVGTFYQNVTGDMNYSGINYLDSPSSTSALTYKLMWAMKGAGATSIYLNRSSLDTDSAAYKRSASSIILMEIEG
jgi:hypothetical protein